MGQGVGAEPQEGEVGDQGQGAREPARTGRQTSNKRLIFVILGVSATKAKDHN